MMTKFTLEQVREMKNKLPNNRMGKCWIDASKDSSIQIDSLLYVLNYNGRKTKVEYAEAILALEKLIILIESLAHRYACIEEAAREMIDTIDDQFPIRKIQEVGLDVNPTFEPWASLFDAKDKLAAVLKEE